MFVRYGEVRSIIIIMITDYLSSLSLTRKMNPKLTGCNYIAVALMPSQGVDSQIAQQGCLL